MQKSAPAVPLGRLRYSGKLNRDCWG